MEIQQTMTLIVESLENYGFFLDAESSQDDPLSSFGIDSYIYISFICDLEEKFQMEFPEEFLDFIENITLNDLLKIIRNHQVAVH